jgi:hypothetical protein
MTLIYFYALVQRKRLEDETDPLYFFILILFR